VDAEEELLVPIQSYLRDNENLRLARATFNKAQEKLVKMEADLGSQKEGLAHLLPCLCMLALVCAHVATIAMHEDADAFPLDTDLYFVAEDRPAAAAAAPVDENGDDEGGRGVEGKEGYAAAAAAAAAAATPEDEPRSSATKAPNANADSKAAVKDQLDKVPWAAGYRDLCALERVVHGVCYTRILAVVACRWFASYQELLSTDERMSAADVEIAKLQQSEEEGACEQDYVQSASLVRMALNDLSNPSLEWRRVALSEQDQGWRPQTRKVLHRPLQRLTVDTRVTTALVYWAGCNNPRVARRLMLWKPKLRGAVTSVSDDAVMWRRLIFRSNSVESALQEGGGDNFASPDGFDAAESVEPPYVPEYVSVFLRSFTPSFSSVLSVLLLLPPSLPPSLSLSHPSHYAVT
jgi:hypothetical protein